MTTARQQLIADLEVATAPDRLLDARIAVLREGGEAYVLEDRPGYFRVPGAGSIRAETIEARTYTKNLEFSRALVRGMPR